MMTNEGPGKVSSTEERKSETYCTGSEYRGLFRGERMEDDGSFTLPTGVQYRGGMKDGCFHGHGILSYPGGGKFEGSWIDGKNMDGVYTFSDGLVYNPKKWNYCIPRDRRFYKEIFDEVKPAGCSLHSNRDPPPPLLPDHRDTGDGFYDPQTDRIYQHDSGRYLRTADYKEKHFILNFCRKGLKPDEVDPGPSTFIN